MAVKRGRPEDERAECEAHLARAFAFLVADHGYRAIGALPLATPGVEARGWSNPAAGVQVEVSSATGGWFFGLLRRAPGGVPVSYDDWTGWLRFTDVALVRSGEVGPNHNLEGWDAAVESGARLLRRNPDLIEGRGWIPRRDAIRAWNRWMSAQHGPGEWIREDAERPNSVLDGFRERFAFLVDLGYALAVDTDRLSPHEYLVGKELRYEKGERSVAILETDFRDFTWRVELDGRPAGDPADFVGWKEEIASRAALVARMIAGA